MTLPAPNALFAVHAEVLAGHAHPGQPDDVLPTLDSWQQALAEDERVAHCLACAEEEAEELAEMVPVVATEVALAAAIQDQDDNR